MTTSREGLLGAVLAGGASRRFGSPKWRAVVGGRTMAARALDALAPWVEARCVVGADPELGSLRVPVVADRRPGRGPLAGLEAALVAAAERDASHAVVVACDLPLVDAAVVGALVQALEPDAAARVPRGARGPEPLCAAYPVAVLPDVASLLDGPGEASLRRLLERIPVRWIEAADLPGGAGTLLNVNRPADRRRAEDRLGPHAAR